MIRENTCAGFFWGGIYFEGYLFWAVQVCVAVGACLAAAVPVPWLNGASGSCKSVAFHEQGSFSLRTASLFRAHGATNIHSFPLPQASVLQRGN